MGGLPKAKISCPLWWSVDDFLIGQNWPINQRSSMRKKAFDTCDHNILLLKLKRYGISGSELEWYPF